MGMYALYCFVMWVLKDHMADPTAFFLFWLEREVRWTVMN